jgi:protein-S-isoprenylcysteine O-methyltransferase Ste14
MNVTRESSDAAGVVVFPPLVAAATVIAALALQWMLPFGLFAWLVAPWRVVTGIVLLALGIAITASAGITLARRGTAVRLSRPTVVLVEDGPFRWTRNPMYVGGSLALLGAAFVFRLDWLPLFLPLSLLVLHFGVVVPEETYLERKFGEPYRRYKSRVPRYCGFS